MKFPNTKIDREEFIKLHTPDYMCSSCEQLCTQDTDRGCIKCLDPRDVEGFDRIVKRISK